MRGLISHRIKNDLNSALKRLLDDVTAKLRYHDG